MPLIHPPHLLHRLHLARLIPEPFGFRQRSLGLLQLRPDAGHLAGHVGGIVVELGEGDAHDDGSQHDGGAPAEARVDVDVLKDPLNRAGWAPTVVDAEFVEKADLFLQGGDEGIVREERLVGEKGVSGRNYGGFGGVGRNGC